MSGYEELRAAGGTEDHTPDSYSESNADPESRSSYADAKVAAAKSDMNIVMKVAADDRSYYGDRAKDFKYSRPSGKEGY